jgi:SRSO17 transposase
VTGDENYGSDGALRGWLEERHRPYVLAVRANEYLWIWDDAVAPQQLPVAVIAARVPEQAWVRLSAGDGAKGPRIYDWALVPRRPGSSSEWQVWLLVRRSRSDPTEVAYYFVYAPSGTPLETIVRVAGRRWMSEEGFEQAKGEVGLDHYEVRRWAGWYRHITLALLAHAYLVVTRARAVAREKKGVPHLPEISSH